MTREGGSVLGGCYCHAFFLVASVCLTLPPSRYITTLPVWWVRLVFGGFARIGRVFLSMEGGMVACVLNREAGTVGNGWLGWGFGGWNCSGRAVLACIFAGCVCLPDVITLRGQNDLPGAKSPSSNRITLRIDRESLIFGGFARIGRAVLFREGVIVARFSWPRLST